MLLWIVLTLCIWFCLFQIILLPSVVFFHSIIQCSNMEHWCVTALCIGNIKAFILSCILLSSVGLKHKRVRIKGTYDIKVVPKSYWQIAFAFVACMLDHFLWGNMQNHNVWMVYYTGFHFLLQGLCERTRLVDGSAMVNSTNVRISYLAKVITF